MIAVATAINVAREGERRARGMSHIVDGQ